MVSSQRSSSIPVALLGSNLPVSGAPIPVSSLAATTVAGLGVIVPSTGTSEHVTSLGAGVSLTGGLRETEALFFDRLSKVADKPRLRVLYQHYCLVAPHAPGITPGDTSQTIIRMMCEAHAVAKQQDAIISSLDLSQLNLQGMDLSHLDLSGANLSEANLQLVTLTDTHLAGANLTSAKVMNANLTGANLTGAQLNDALLIAATMNNTQLTDACLKRADLTKATLTGAILNGATLDQVNLNDAELTGAALVGASLRYATLERACVTAGDLRKARLDRANLKKANLSGCNLQGANLKGATLVGVDLRGGRLQGVQWDRTTNLELANLSRTDWRGCCFGWVNPGRGWYEGPGMRGVDFSYADLSGCHLGTTEGVDFRYADLSGCHLGPINFDPVSVSCLTGDTFDRFNRRNEHIEYKLHYVRLTGATVENTIFVYDSNDHLYFFFSSLCHVTGVPRITGVIPDFTNVDLNRMSLPRFVLDVDLTGHDTAGLNRLFAQRVLKACYVTPLLLTKLMSKRSAAMGSPDLKVAATPEECRDRHLASALEAWIDQQPTARIYLLRDGNPIDRISPKILSRVDWDAMLKSGPLLTEDRESLIALPRLLHAVLEGYSTVSFKQQAQIQRVYGNAPLWQLLNQATMAVGPTDPLKSTVQFGCGDMPFVQFSEQKCVVLGYPSHKQDVAQYLMTHDCFMAFKDSDQPSERAVADSSFQVATEETLVVRIIQLLCSQPDLERDRLFGVLKTHCKASNRVSIVETLCDSVTWFQSPNQPE